MTREEAIHCIKHEFLINVNRKDLIGQTVGEALDMAIEALSQPIVCTDFCIAPDHIYCAPEMAEKVIEALQSRPKGEWIDKEIPCEPYPPVFFVECSKCGYRVGRETFLENTFNFCPCCGADMRGADR